MTMNSFSLKEESMEIAIAAGLACRSWHIFEPNGLFGNCRSNFDVQERRSIEGPLTERLDSK